MIKTLSKDSLDWLWAKLHNLESKPKPSTREKKEIGEITKSIELNARKLVWNQRGIVIIEGGKAKKAA